MPRRTEIKTLLATEPQGQSVTLMGWVRTFRANRFIALNDGSTLNNLQVVVDFENYPEDLLSRISTSASIKVVGTLVASQGKGQAVEVMAEEIEVLGDADPSIYPIQPKKHSLEFLREKAHLRMRTNTFASVFRIRHGLAYAIHKYFHDHGFYYMHTPIITA
ncbi:MAG: OB-fold nucleic acid binding domain-containing protein, partial [Bacteroidota bacterium]